MLRFYYMIFEVYLNINLIYRYILYIYKVMDSNNERYSYEG